MALSEDKANRDAPGWSEDALHGVELYCLANPGKEFLAEEAREWAEAMELVDPAKNERAWGAVLRRAAKLQIIRKVGYAPAKSSNLSPKVLWRAV